MRLLKVLGSIGILFLTTSCELVKDPEEDIMGSTYTACCYKTATVSQYTDSEYVMDSKRNFCTMDLGYGSSGTWQRGACDTTGMMAGYCRVGNNNSWTIHYAPSSYSLSSAQSNCSSNSSNGASGIWIDG